MESDHKATGFVLTHLVCDITVTSVTKYRERQRATSGKGSMGEEYWTSEGRIAKLDELSSLPESDHQIRHANRVVEMEGVYVLSLPDTRLDSANCSNNTACHLGIMDLQGTQ